MLLGLCVRQTAVAISTCIYTEKYLNLPQRSTHRPYVYHNITSRTSIRGITWNLYIIWYVKLYHNNSTVRELYYSNFSTGTWSTRRFVSRVRKSVIALMPFAHSFIVHAIIECNWILWSNHIAVCRICSYYDLNTCSSQLTFPVLIIQRIYFTSIRWENWFFMHLPPI